MAIRNGELNGIDFQDTGSTNLDGALTDSATTVTVDSTTGFKSAGTIRINSELIDYASTTATTFTGCTRGQYFTTAAAHSDNDAVAEREVLKAQDLNDTFDAAASKIRSLSAFWLNPELYDVYDNFESSSSEIKVEILATSISSLGDFSINNCTLVSDGGGQWTLTSSSISAEVQRAEIYKTLFYGTDGTNPRASATYITAITALKTSVVRDVDKRAYYARVGSTNASISIPTNTDGIALYDLTFNDTTNNTDCSSWSYIKNSWAGGSIGPSTWGRWEMPEGTVLNEYNTVDNGASDEMGADTSGDEYTNPADAQLEAWWGDQGGSDQEVYEARTVILCEGTITFTENESGDALPAGMTYGNTDFFTDNSIPLFTATSTTAWPGDGSLWVEGTITGNGNNTIVDDDTPSGTTSKVLQMSIGAGGTANSDCQINTVALAVDKHTHIKAALKSSSNSNGGVEWGRIRVKLGSSGTQYTLLNQNPSGNNASIGEIYMDVSVIAKGSDTYDLLVGGRVLESNISEADPQLYFEVDTQYNATVFQIDDVVQSKSAIN